MSDPNVPTQVPATLSSQKVAIVFVPGVMGSRLRFSGATPDWDPDNGVQMLQWVKLPPTIQRDCMSADGQSSAKKASVILDKPPARNDMTILNKIPGGVAAQLYAWDKPLTDYHTQHRYQTVACSFYGDFLLTFNDRLQPNIELYAYGYDWRLPIKVLGANLAADLLAATGGSDIYKSRPLVDPSNPNAPQAVILISHSMGGLVTRSALKQSTQLQKLTAGVLHVVQPATGATTFYRRCLTGCVDPWDGIPIFCKILGPSGPSFSTVVSRLPGPINLFPSPRLSADLKNKGTPGLISYTKYADTCMSNLPSQPGSNDSESQREIKFWIQWPEVSGDIYSLAKGTQDSSPPGIVRTDIQQASQTGLGNLLDGTKDFHSFISKDGTPGGAPWYLQGRTWAVFGTGIETDTTMHYLNYDWPNVKKKILGGYYIQKPGPNGTIDEDLGDNVYDWRGFIDKPLYITASDSPIGPRGGRSAHGDETVPDMSASALFGIDEQNKIDAAQIDWDSQHQFAIDGLHHGAAFLQSSPVFEFAWKWLQYILSQPFDPNKQSATGMADPPSGDDTQNAVASNDSGTNDPGSSAPDNTDGSNSAGNDPPPTNA